MPDSLQIVFLTLVPRIERHARVSFRHVKCYHQKEEAIAEAVALAWKSYVRLVARGKDVTSLVATLASFAVRGVRSGLRLCGQEKVNDVFSPRARRRHDFTVTRLPDSGTSGGKAWEEALLDNTRSGVPEQVCFRCDFPAWRCTRSERDRQVMDALMVGERTRDVAQKYGLSPGRISQLRRELRADWEQFCAAPEGPKQQFDAA